ncbi:MAG: helix-turn-helix transcriptional regulator [Roseibium sp.]
MARPETEPKTPLARRLRDIRRAQGDIERGEVAKRLGISANSVSRYERGEQEPSYSVFAAYSSVFSIDLNWLLTGNGSMFLGGDTKISRATLPEVRKYIWNIAETFWSKVPRRTKPDAFADQFLEMFDYLLSREDVKDDVASEVIQFEAERLKRASEKSE